MPSDTSRFSDNPFRDPNLSPEQVAVIEARNKALRIYHATGDPRPAREAGLFPIPDEEHSADDYIKWGFGYIKAGDYDQAIADFDHAIRIAHTLLVDACNGRGNAYIGKGDYDNAIADFDRAIFLSPNDVSGYYNRGIAHGQKGDYDSAIADFDSVISINPNDADAYHMRADAYTIKAQQDRQKAQELSGE